MARQSKAAVRARKPKGDDVGRPGRPRSAQNEVTSDLISTGCATMAQIAALFRTDAKTLPQRLKLVPSEGKNRNGYNIYDIRKAASFIVTPGYEIEEFIRQMSPQELPPLLQKEFWNGQNARLKHERELGNLWPTEDVAEFVGQLLSTVRMTALLVADDVDREDSLTDGQKQIVRRIMDGLITTLKDKLAERFKDFHASRAPTRLDEDDDDLTADYGEDDEPFEEDDDALTALAEEDDDRELPETEDDEEEDIGI
jgi:hypothetical protein